MTSRANLVVPRGRGSLFTAVWRGAGGAEADTAIWGFSDAAGRFPADVTDLDGAALRQLVLDRIAGWSPAFHRLVGGSDPATVNALRIRSAAPVDPWPTGRVTLLGDAIHNMTPMAGVGANTALRDADLLRRELTGAGRPGRGGRPLRARDAATTASPPCGSRCATPSRPRTRRRSAAPASARCCG